MKIIGKRPAPDPLKQEFWERTVLTDLVMQLMAEKRAARRWGVFFKLLGFAYLFILLLVLIPTDHDWGKLAGSTEDRVALINIKGIIADGAEANADAVVTALRNAYEADNTKGIILRINSPGGSPVQAAYVYDEIRRLKNKHPDIPVYAVAVDLCASAAYYIASATDKIYANESSIVGSIGVLMDGFGFVETLDKLGVERRLMTAGEHKGLMDPFSPLREQEQAFVQEMLDQIHQQFIGAVRNGRGDRLTSASDTLFSGLFWTGREAMKLGLVDAMGSSSYVAREVIGVEEMTDYTVKEDWLTELDKRLGKTASLIQGWSEQLTQPWQLR